MVNTNIIRAVRKYLRQQAKDWWKTKPASVQDAVCDACNGIVERNKGYRLGTWLRCDRCYKEKIEKEMKKQGVLNLISQETLIRALTKYAPEELAQLAEESNRQKRLLLEKKEKEARKVEAKRKDIRNMLLGGVAKIIISGIVLVVAVYISIISGQFETAGFDLGTFEGILLIGGVIVFCWGLADLSISMEERKKIGKKNLK
jgi:hypothetical protein